MMGVARRKHQDAGIVGAGGKLTPLRRLRIDPLGGGGGVRG